MAFAFDRDLNPEQNYRSPLGRAIEIWQSGNRISFTLAA